METVELEVCMKLPYFRYMSFFQWPLLPELMMCSDDAKLCYGLPTLSDEFPPGKLSQEDLEAFKYMYATYGTFHMFSLIEI